MTTATPANVLCTRTLTDGRRIELHRQLYNFALILADPEDSTTYLDRY